MRFSRENISVSISAVSAIQFSPPPALISTLSSVGSTSKNLCLSASSALGRSVASVPGSASYGRGRNNSAASSHPAPSPASNTAVLDRLNCPLFASRHLYKSYLNFFKPRLNPCKPLFVRKLGMASCMSTMPALYISNLSGLCDNHAVVPAASAIGPNIFFKSGASSVGIKNSSGGAYLGSIIVSSGVKLVPVRKHAHAPRSITLNVGSGFSASTKLCGFTSRCTKPALCTAARLCKSCDTAFCVISNSAAASPLNTLSRPKSALANPVG